MEVNFSWFTNGSYLKDEDDKYCAVYAISTPFDIIEASPLPRDPMAQPAKLYVLMGMHPSQGQIANIYTDCRYAFGESHDSEML